MAKDALTAHARDELGISESTTARPVQAALTSALSFSVGAAMPLLMVVVSPAGCACPDRGGCVPGLSRPSGSDRRMGRRRQRSARHGPGDILGHVGDGSHGRHREAFGHRYLKIGAREELSRDLVRSWALCWSKQRQRRLRFASNYHRPTIHFAPRTVSQIAANSNVATTTALKRASESRSPSSSR